MIASKFIVFYSVIIPWIWACQRNGSDPPLQAPAIFDTTPVSAVVHSSITEASGIVDSKMNAGFMWVHEDSGTPPRILLLKKDGTLSKSVEVDGATNIDWEDMSLAKGPDASLDYIYVADFGDNARARSEYAIYRFPEPGSGVDVVHDADKIRFKYPDGAHDAEAMVVDNSSRDIYLITKSDNPSRIYKLPFPQNTSTVTEAISVGEMSFGGATAAAISPDGKEIIIKTYPAVRYFERKAGETIEAALKKTPINLPYQLEPQGEAVAFAADNSGFYTISEKAFSSVVKLYFYKRK